ncbi:MAG: DUF222 domain-containing protein [Ilumatobacteraceae bacterium]
MVAVLEQLDATVDAVLDLDPDSLTDGELHAAIVDLQAQRARLGVAAAVLLERWDRRSVWAADGSRSAAGRLARDTNTSLRSAGVEMRRARQLAGLPATRRSITAGVLSLDHIDLFGRANRAWRSAVFAEHEAGLVDQCTRLRFAEAVRLVKYWCHHADAEAAEQAAERSRAGAHLHASPTLDGDVDISGRLDAIGGAIFTGELKRLEHELYLADIGDGVVASPAQRRARAVVEMARRSASAPAGGRRPKPLFVVLMGDESFTRMCELANGTVITPGQLVAWLGDAELETVLFDGPTTVVSVSQRRCFTGALRRAIEVRDRHCQHPSGCDVPADACDVDHIVPRALHGETSQFNGRLECPTHNRHPDKHDHGATGLPPRPVTRLDELRARLRWRHQHNNNNGDDGDGDNDVDDADDGTGLRDAG